MLANWITLSRFPLLLLSVVALYHGAPGVRIAGAALVFVGLMLDTVDGVIARRKGQCSLIGSVLDIAADRTYELVLWVCFADLRLVPAAIPIIVLTRTTLTDALRSIGLAEGTVPFEQHRSRLGRFLVRSAWMRTGYSAGKIATFTGLASAWAVAGTPAGPLPAGALGPMLAALRVLAWATVVLCLARGFPVLIGSLRRYWGGARRAVPIEVGG